MHVIGVRFYPIKAVAACYGRISLDHSPSPRIAKRRHAIPLHHAALANFACAKLGCAKLPDSRTRLRSSPLVIGLGSDLIEIERIERSYQRFGDAFLQRVFTPGEIAYCMAKKNFAESLAARFAAKEAGAKALGTGISRGVSWREFEVRRRPGQRPELHLSGRALEIANALGIRHIALTLSHARSLSIAFVVAED
jgi:holo-[acyl-carrier protein] synthase